MYRLKIIFNLKERKKISLIILGIFFMASFELIGVASIAPFMALVSNPDVIETNVYLSAVYHYFGFDSTKVFLTMFGISMLGILIISNGFNAYMNWVIIHFSRMQGHRLAVRLLKQYLSQPYLFFLNSNTANLGKNLLTEIDRCIAGIFLPGLIALSRLAVVVFILVFLLFLDPFIAVSTIVVLAVAYGLIFVSVRKKLHRMGVASTNVESARFKTANEAMSGIKDLKLRGKEQEFVDRFAIPSEARAKYTSISQVMTMLPRYLLDTIAFGGIVTFVIYLVASGYSSGEVIPIISLYAVAGYRLMPALQQIYASSTQLKYNLPALDILVKDIASFDGEAQFLNKQASSLTFTKELILKNIHFNYPNLDESVLKGLNINIKPNTTIGFVGSTGSGKTTLVDIILGLLSSSQGKIFVDDVEITNKNISSWQANLGYVPQTIYLIDDTIVRNIAFAIPDKDIEMHKVVEAAKLAELDEFIQTLPEQFHTSVGERGVRLSGGQRQRIGIARALYHNPEVLILDEATSALDGITENVIMDAINNLSHKKTILMIAHRLATVKECDVIYVMENGRFVDSGSYQELLNRNEIFRKMANV